MGPCPRARDFWWPSSGPFRILGSLSSFGYIQAWSGGSQKSITGHFSLFSVDQSHVGGVVNKFNNVGAGKNIYVVLCGRMTPAQRRQIKNKASLYTDLFLHLLTWFIKTAAHKGYADVTPPAECPDPIVILQDEENDNNTDDSVDPATEIKTGETNFYFSNASQDPSSNASVFDRSSDFIKSK